MSRGLFLLLRNVMQIGGEPPPGTLLRLTDRFARKAGPRPGAPTLRHPKLSRSGLVPQAFSVDAGSTRDGRRWLVQSKLGPNLGHFEKGFAVLVVVGFGRPTQAFSGVVLILVGYGPHHVVPNHTSNLPDGSTPNNLTSSAVRLPA